MRRRKQQGLKKPRHGQPDQSSRLPRSLRFQHLESRQLLAGDLGVEPLADITGLWVTVGNREYYTSELASVTIDMFAGETLQVTGIQYSLDESFAPEDGVIAFESYVRREHGAAEIGSYDYTDGRFGNPVAEDPVAGQIVTHPGIDSGWQLDVIDNRIAVVAIRYFGDEFAVEDRLLVDVNVVQPPETTSWTEAITPVSGDWEVTENAVAGDSIDHASGLTVVETGTAISQRFEVGVKAKTVQENTFANGFVVVDFRNENDFVYAGLRLTDNQWVIGHFDGNFNDLATLTQDIQPRQVYDLRVAVDGSHIALAADGILRVSHDFARPLDQGVIGLANQYAYTHFTELAVFDNSAGLITAPTPQQAYDAAQIAAAQAQQASDAATAIANDAEQESGEAETLASELESASTQANTAASDADSAHDGVIQAVAATEQLIQQAAATIQSASLEQQAAVTSVQELAVTLADAEQTASALNQQNAAAQQTVNELAEQLVSVQQAADEAVSASQAAAIAATVAREASDVAAQLAEDAPKPLRKELKKSAKEADKIADAAEDDAKDAADTAADALQELHVASQPLNDAQQVADQTAQALTEAANVVQTTQESLDGATNTLNMLTQTIRETEAAQDAAVQQLPQLRQQLSQLAEQATLANDAAELAAQQANAARADANLAAGEAETSTAEALRLAQEAETANQTLAAAELTLQEAIEQDDAFTAYSLNFNRQDDGAFEAVAGKSELVAGQLHLAPGADLFAVSVLDNDALPERTATRVYTTVRADTLPGLYQNGFIVFDYQSPEDFKYAGAWAGADRWAIGEVVDGQHVDLATLDEVIGQGPAYELQIWIEDSTLTFLAEGQQKLQHAFDQAIDDGQIGVFSYNSQSRFDQVAVMQLYGGAGDVGIEHADTNPAANDAAINELF